jgi:phenylpyruvate tautomerase PptA (4-oxalocrotonate tautomerase family)
MLSQSGRRTSEFKIRGCESNGMSQVKVFGLRSNLGPRLAQVSDVIHSCVVDALVYPKDKRAHRFIQLEPEEFFYPAGRTENYTILEISMFEGRSTEAKKKLIRLLIERFETQLGIAPVDVEITIFETPKHNWGFRGLPGDEHELNYKVEV